MRQGHFASATAALRDMSDRQFSIIVAVLYVLITIWMTWPLPRHAGSAVQDPGDPVFEIWVMRTVQHRLVNEPLDLFQANIFYPFNGSLAYSEEAISSALAAWPVQLLTGNDVLAYNFVVLSSFWLVAFGIYLLSRELGAHSGAAFLAGVLAAFAPIRYAQLSHLHMLVIGWLLLVLWALTVFARGGRQRYLLVAGAALTMQLLGSLHLAVYATMGIALFLPFLLVFERHKRPWTRTDVGLLAGALIVPYLILLPTLLPHFDAGHEYGFTRTRDEVARWSAIPRNFIALSLSNRYWPDGMHRMSTPLFPGVVALIGSALAIIWARTWSVLFAGVLALVAAVFSLGFAVDIAGRSIPLPYALVYELLPPIQNMRVVGRFGLLIAIGLPLMAAIGYSTAWKKLSPRVSRNAGAVGLGLTALLTLVACIELRAEPGIWQVDYGQDSLAVYEWLGDQPAGPMIEFPANGLLDARSRPPNGIFQPLQYMYGSTRHWNPLVNGYSGFIPPQHHRLLRVFETEDHPSLVTADTVGILGDLGVRYVLIHRFPDYDWETAIAAADEIPGLQRLAAPGNSAVYEVIPVDRVRVASRVEIPDRSKQDWYFNVRLLWDNPNHNLALATLERDLEAWFEWLDLDGNVYREEVHPLYLPIAVPPGERSISLQLTTPDQPGKYLLQVSITGDVIPPTEQEVMVDPVDDRERVALRLDTLEWELVGELLEVDVTWLVLEPLDADFAATLQILDERGERRLGIDLLPESGMPPTSAWRTGDLETVTFRLELDDSLPHGEYQLMTALYAYQPGYPRLQIVRPDGSTATEMISDGLVWP